MAYSLGEKATALLRPAGEPGVYFYCIRPVWLLSEKITLLEKGPTHVYLSACIGREAGELFLGSLRGAAMHHRESFPPFWYVLVLLLCTEHLPSPDYKYYLDALMYQATFRRRAFGGAQKPPMISRSHTLNT